MTTNQAWEELVKDLDLSLPFNRISAQEIKNLGKEPRLMTKFDSSVARPDILKKNGLFLLPETNKGYYLVHEEGYQKLPHSKSEAIEDYNPVFPIHLESLQHASSEMNHLDRLFLCGLIQKFLGVDVLCATIRGRKFAPPFDYFVGEHKLSASGIQYEVDQGYESADEIILFEAKNTTPSDFLTRQLYFPYRVFSTLCRKPIRNVFFNFNSTDSLFSFFEYEFEEPNQYQSLILRKERHYRVKFPEVAPASHLDLLLSKSRINSSNRRWEIPQADDFGKIMDFPVRISDGFNDAALIASAFDFAPRQSNYYQRASEQMGLVKGFELTDEGRHYLTMSLEERTLWMIGKMVEQPIIREVLEKSRDTITLEFIIGLVEKHSNLSGETIRRRAQSVRSWLKFLQTNLGEIRVNDRILKLE